MSSQSSRQSGTVSWFNEEKGFGFITAEDGRDVFVHYSEVQRDGFQTLNVGEKVTFLIAEEGPAPKAASVRLAVSGRL